MGIFRTVSLFFKEGNSDKVYKVIIEEADAGYLVNFAFGRRDSKLQTGTKTTSPVSEGKANEIFDKLVHEKMAKGYTLDEQGTPFTGTLKEEKKSNILPQLLNSIEFDQLDKYINDDNWATQQKIDGVRILYQVENGIVIAINRTGIEVETKPLIAKEVLELAQEDQVILDGEVVGDNYYIFDLIKFNDDLKPLSYQERLGRLMKLTRNWQAKNCIVIDTAFRLAEKKKMLVKLMESNAEGVVLKNLKAEYKPGRPNSLGDQLKYKFVQTVSVMVMGINDKRSIIMGLIKSNEIKTVGNVSIPPNMDIPNIGDIVEVKYLYAFKATDALFQPVYLGVRNDVQSFECKIEQLKYKSDEDIAKKDPESDLIQEDDRQLEYSPSTSVNTKAFEYSSIDEKHEEEQKGVGNVDVPLLTHKLDKEFNEKLQLYFSFEHDSQIDKEFEYYSLSDFLNRGMDPNLVIFPYGVPVAFLFDEDGDREKLVDVGLNMRLITEYKPNIAKLTFFQSYYRSIKKLYELGVNILFPEELSEFTGINTQDIYQEFMNLAMLKFLQNEEYDEKGFLYIDVPRTIQFFDKYIDQQKSTDVFLFGTESFNNFEWIFSLTNKYKANIKCAFENVGSRKEVSQIPVYTYSEIQKLINGFPCVAVIFNNIGTQELVDYLESLGVREIIDFSNIHVQVSPNMHLVKLDLGTTIKEMLLNIGSSSKMTVYDIIKLDPIKIKSDNLIKIMDAFKIFDELDIEDDLRSIDIVSDDLKITTLSNIFKMIEQVLNRDKKEQLFVSIIEYIESIHNS